MVGSLVVIAIMLVYMTGWHFGYQQGKNERKS